MCSRQAAFIVSFKLLGRRFYYPHFTDEKTESQRVKDHLKDPQVETDWVRLE